MQNAQLTLRELSLVAVGVVVTILMFFAAILVTSRNDSVVSPSVVLPVYGPDRYNVVCYGTAKYEVQTTPAISCVQVETQVRTVFCPHDSSSNCSAKQEYQSDDTSGGDGAAVYPSSKYNGDNSQ